MRMKLWARSSNRESVCFARRGLTVRVRPGPPLLLKGYNLEKPCDECLIAACCSAPCRKHAEYIYENKKYPESVQRNIKVMKYEDAISHIIAIESVWFYLERISE
jgi:hypothetical protein